MNISDIITIPNILSFLRLLASPFMLILVRTNIFLAFIVFVMLSISDALDGFIARITNSVSILGKILDPIADKSLLIFTSLAFVNTKQKIPIFFVKLLILREGLIIVGGIVLIFMGVVPKPSIVGKITTFCMIVILSALFYENIEDRNFGGMELFYDIGIGLIVLSFFEYLKHTIKIIASIKRYKVLK